MDEQNYKRRLEKFSSSLGARLQIYREEKRRWDPFLSTDFNVVSEFIRPKENRLSDIIACLLDANGSHGQQGKFLDAFLRCLFEPDRVAELSGKQRWVKREVPTYYNDENQRRRIDITIDFKNFGIGIENKPWADESDRQLEDYDKHLKRTYDQQYCLVFITPDGRKPKSINDSGCRIKKGELYCLSYRSHILEWIEECRQLCESDRFRWFLHDFRSYIRNEPFTFWENTMQTNKRETEIIMEHVKNNENLEVALDIISRTQKIRERIIKTFLKNLEGFICKRLDMSQWDLKKELGYTSQGNISLSFGVSNQDEPISILLQSYGKVIFIGVFTDNSRDIVKCCGWV